MEIEKLQIDFEGHKKICRNYKTNKQIFSIEIEIPELWINKKHPHLSILILCTSSMR